uniref:T9SS type A sorting domain-containing protein n=1 Tax=candidate division WOR-3 bacterium TaxID=2052148 RepID=A0A7C4GCV3_UNCW3
MFVTILAAALIAISPAGTGGAVAPVMGGGGPDAYGYRYLDSDTTCPGAPTYNWVNIKGVGTRITTLGDDNVAGPFSIGFDFPYYWYKVNKVFVGSNGYIAFHDNGLAASPFNPVPGPQRPNNTLAILMSDIDCAARGSVWYWTNTAQDTFIVQWDSVPFWSTGGNNTMQIILSKRDSSVTFQYKEQSGQPYNGWAPTGNQTGIENVSGQVGLNYLSGTNPSQNMYHPELAVRFFPPESTTMQVHDVGVFHAMNEFTAGMFHPNNRPLSFWAVVRNFGNQPEGQFKTYVRVSRSGGTVVHYDSMMARATTPGETDSLAFTQTWRPTTNGVYTLKFWTKLTGDAVPTNDTATIELRVLTLPGTLTYDNGVSTHMMSWNGPGGFGNRFIPPVYPCSIASARMFMAATTPTVTSVGIFDDNGPGGGPGDTLYIANVTVSAQNWYTVTPPSPVVITEGTFFVGGMSEISSSPSFGMDSIPPLSFQGWEYTGVWAPGRDAPLRDVMANAAVSGPVGLVEWIEPAPRPVPTRIEVTPNPARGAARMRLLSPRGDETAIDVFNAAGTVVRTLPLDGSMVVFDGRDKTGAKLAEGIYFVRVAGFDSPVAKVILSR